MSPHTSAAIAVGFSLALAAPAAHAADKFTFPSSSGAQIAATAPQFGTAASGISTPAAFVLWQPASYASRDGVPPPTPYDEHFTTGHGTNPYALQFLTYALSQAAFANYAADYQRLFAPNAALSRWTERVSGIVEAGYGGAVDGWTAGAYLLGNVRGPRHRAETPPDLTAMPKFGPHPELEERPTFLIEQ